MDELAEPFEIVPGRAYTICHVARFLRSTDRAIRDDLIKPGHLKVFEFKRGKEVVLGFNLIACISKLTNEGGIKCDG